MADIFTRDDARSLLKNKTVWLFGDSNVRAMYKDLIWLIEKNSLIDLSSLRGKLEKSFFNDILVKGGALHRGRNFQEIRKYKNFKLEIEIEFTFLTQCMSADIQGKLLDVQHGKKAPDVVIVNSCLWDLTRWGPEGVEKYKANIINLLQLLKSSLPSRTRMIWTTTPPISHEPRGGFFIKQINFLKHTLRFEVMESNAFVSREVARHGFDVLDIHYHLLLQIHRRRPDGIHWNPEAVRHITNLVLTHLCLCWNVPLPGNFKTPLLKGYKTVSGLPVAMKRKREDSPESKPQVFEEPKRLKAASRTKKKRSKRNRPGGKQRNAQKRANLAVKAGFDFILNWNQRY